MITSTTGPILTPARLEAKLFFPIAEVFAKSELLIGHAKVPKAIHLQQ